MELVDFIEQVSYILYNFVAFLSGLLLGYLISKLENR